MTTVVIVKCPEGLVLAADSRMTVSETSGGREKHWPSDTLLKILSFKPPHNFVGAVSWDRADINQKSASCYSSEFEQTLPENRIPINEFAEKLFCFFSCKWNESPERKYSSDSLNPMKFFVAGFDEKDEYGRIFEIKISDNHEIADMHELPAESKPDIVLRGNSIYASRLWFGYSEQLPKLLANTDWARQSALNTGFLEDAMSKSGLQMTFSPNLRDGVALAKLLIRTEIDAQALTEAANPWLKAVTGGPIRICTITSEHGLKWVL